MTETTLRLAFERAGFATKRLENVVPMSGRVEQIVEPSPKKERGPSLDVSSMSDDQLAQELGKLVIDVEDITRQLDDDGEVGMGKDRLWRINAATARRHLRSRIDQIRVEMKSRASEARARSQLKPQAGIRRARLRLERTRLHAEAVAKVSRKKSQQEMFCQAAHHLLSEEETGRIWDYARKRFPHSDAWAEAARHGADGQAMAADADG